MADTKDVAVVRTQAGKAVTEANALQITDQEGYEKATDLLTRIKAAVKMVTEAKDAVLRPLLDATAAERARWRPIEDEAKTAEQIVKAKMLQYVNETERKAQEEAARIQREADAGRIKKPETVMRKLEQVEQAPAQVRTEQGASTVRKVKVVRIEQPELVPDKYWTIDEVAVRRDALAGTDIPGVTVTLENSIAVLR